MLFRDQTFQKLGNVPVFIVSIILIIAGFNLANTDIPEAESTEPMEFDTGYLGTISNPDLNRMGFNPNGSTLAYTDYHGQLINKFVVVNVLTSKSTTLDQSQIFDIVSSNNTSAYMISKLKWSPNGNLIVAVEQNNKIAIWDVSSNNYTVLQALVNIYDPDFFPFKSVSWSPDSTKIAVALYNSTVLIWNALSGKIDNYFYINHNVIAVEWSPNGDHIAFVGGSNMGIIDLINHQIRIIDDSIDEHLTLFSWEDDDIILLGDNTRNFEFWSFGKNKLIKKIKLPFTPSKAQFLQSDKIVVSSSRSGIIISQSNYKTLAKFTGAVIHADLANSKLFLLHFSNFSKLDYSNVKYDYNIYRFKNISGTLLTSISLVTVYISIVGIQRKIKSVTYVN